MKIIEVSVSEDQHLELMKAAIESTKFDLEPDRLYLQCSTATEEKFKETLIRILGAEVVEQTWKRSHEVSIKLNITKVETEAVKR